MLKRNKWKILVSSLVTLLPILVGLILWDKLPERMPSHWGVGGEVDGYSPRWVSVFAIPGFMLVVHLICLAVTAMDPKNGNHPEKVIDLLLCICPMMSLLVNSIVYAVAMGAEISVGTWVMAATSILFIVIGNYLPKCRRNYTIGIKLPWTLDSDENWNATHRLAGKIWVVGGFLILASSFLPEKAAVWIYIPVVVLMAMIPSVYSYLYYKRSRT